MKIVLDMNISPAWVKYFKNFGIESIHWTHVGELQASDEEIFLWAKNNDYIIITQDLDFSAILAFSNSEKPSVILIRGKNSLPENIGTQLIEVLKTYSSELETGVHIVLDSISSRIRILPLN